MVAGEFDNTDTNTLSEVTGSAIDKELALLLNGTVLTAPMVKDPISAGTMAFGFGTASEAAQVAAQLGAEKRTT